MGYKPHLKSKSIMVAYKSGEKNVSVKIYHAVSGTFPAYNTEII